MGLCCCIYFCAVLSEEQKQNLSLFIDPVTKFFEASLLAVSTTCTHVHVHVHVYIHVYTPIIMNHLLM